MKDIWYADNRDIVKWSVLHQLARLEGAVRILQIAYYRPSGFAHIQLDGQTHDVPDEVLDHFRNIRNITTVRSPVRTTVFDVPFENRAKYHESAIHFLLAFDQERCLVFLDPDTGLEPQNNPGLEHVLDAEARQVWDSMKTDDVLVFYQHQTNRAGQPWMDPKRIQLAEALGVDQHRVRVGYAPEIARDVAFFYMKKP
ncbi:MAG: hypothetical protein ABIP48_14375 [Planctomycetota bacterium]